MGTDTKDFRGEISRETDVWLEAEERVYGRTRQDVVRELLHAHALKRLHEASVIIRLAEANGIKPEDAGVHRQSVSGRRR